MGAGMCHPEVVMAQVIDRRAVPHIEVSILEEKDQGENEAEEGTLNTGNNKDRVAWVLRKQRMLGMDAEECAAEKNGDCTRLEEKA